MEIFMLYLMVIADNLHKFFETISGIFFLGIVATTIGLFIVYVENLPDVIKKYKNLYVTAITISITFAFLSAIMPSTKNMALILGGKLALDISKSDSSVQVLQAIKDRVLRELNRDITEKSNIGEK